MRRSGLRRGSLLLWVAHAAGIGGHATTATLLWLQAGHRALARPERNPSAATVATLIDHAAHAVALAANLRGDGIRVGLRVVALRRRRWLRARRWSRDATADAELSHRCEMVLATTGTTQPHTRRRHGVKCKYERFIGRHVQTLVVRASEFRWIYQIVLCCC
jgi:hypothetical protein